jgi:DNA-binding MurR/RpiR family transcriptional regulator
MNFMSKFISDESGNPEDVFVRLSEGAKNFSSRQAALCQYILTNYQQVAFWSVEELSQNSGVSPATVVRTVKSLEFSSYHQLRKCFEKLIIENKSTVFWETAKSFENDAAVGPALAWIAKDNVNAINDSITPGLLDEMKAAYRLLQKARRIYIMALRSSRGAGIFFYSILTQAFDNMGLIPYGADEMYDHLVDLTPEDVLVSISLGGPHYTYNTIKATKYAHKNGVPTVLVTNDISAPAVEFADIKLVVARTLHHYSIVPALTVLEAIVVELGQSKKSSVVKKFNKLEPVLIDEKITF